MYYDRWLQGVKKFNENAKVFVCGCASQHNSKRFLEKDVEVVMGVGGKLKIIEFIESLTKKLVYTLKSRVKRFFYSSYSKNLSICEKIKKVLLISLNLYKYML